MTTLDLARAARPPWFERPWLVAVLYAALTLVMAYPLSLHPASMALPGDPDTDLFMWTLGWNTHALAHHPLSIFESNIYHPHRLTLAFSENLIGSTPFAAPVLWTIGNPVLALNVVALSSVVLCAIGAWLLARRVGAGPYGALICGLVFGFSPARFMRLGQLHLTTIQWIPFCLAFLHSYLDTGRKRDLRLAIAFFTLQALTSGHGAAFLTVGVVCLLAYRALLGEPFAVVRRLRDLGVPGVLLGLPAILLFVPYRIVQNDVGLRRTLDRWAPAPESFLASPALLHASLLSMIPDARINEQASAYLFPGILPVLMSGAALLSTARIAWAARPWREWLWLTAATMLEIIAAVSLTVCAATAVAGPVRLHLGSTRLLYARDGTRALVAAVAALALRAAIARRVPFLPRVRHWLASIGRSAAARRRDPIAFYGLLTLVSVLLAAGPPVGIWPYVYWLPGLNFIRGPSRFMLLGTLGVAVLTGLCFERFTARLDQRRQAAAAAVVALLLMAEFLSIPLPGIRPYRVDIPSVDRWLGAQPGPFAVAEFPVLPLDRIQSTYMLHSMAHWQKTIHGHSGIRTPFHVDLYNRLRSFPEVASLRSLADIGVTWVVVHIDLYPPERWAEIDQRLQEHSAWLKLAYADRAGRAYSLIRPEEGYENR